MRLAAGGIIDRAAPRSFTFNGRTLSGFAGDTLASALLANDVRLVGRSFKYHRPRGIVSAGSEEPSALVTLGSGSQRDPNHRAPSVELFDGLAATSQNHLGPLWFDALAINDWLAPFLGAGFYYKTFMWPASFWERLYEPMIRRAAGLGALSGQADQDSHDKAWAHCDLLVIGAGPAGLMAALAAGRAGQDVILADADFRLGGRLLSEVQEVGETDGATWAALATAELAALPNVRIMARTTVVGAYDGGVYGAVEQVSAHLASAPGHAPKSTFWRITTERAVLASGAIERMIAFPNNDRPGIMQAGAVRGYLNRFAVAPKKRVVVFTNNDDGWRTARDCLAAGINVGAVVDTRADGTPAFPGPVHLGAQVVDTRGRLGLAAVQIRRNNGDLDWVEADCLAVSGGWNPTIHLACHLGARAVWDADIGGHVAPDGAVPGLTIAGAAAGARTTAAALASGVRAAGSDTLVPPAEDAEPAAAPFWFVDAPGRAWLDFQNDVTVKDVRQSMAESLSDAEHVKRYTTLGMATDQGKIGNATALAVIADGAGAPMDAIAPTTYRPPFVPVPVAALGARASGRDFAPERRTPMHMFCQERGAPMMEAGTWYRPSWFPNAAETHWRDSCDREVRHVREAVGVSDVSTLGKIDIQGPDAAAFLDRVYTNTMSTLNIGRVRYGLMLREDGFVMDDGTCARLSADHFVITTTTAAAGPVMAHLEFVHQGLFADLDVTMLSVSDAWAQIAVAGPKCRDALAAVLDTVPDDAAMPYMGCGPVAVGGIDARLFRISFSGEMAYELAIPARYGDAVFRRLVERAEALGGGVYGMEALNVLRIEKGFITHAEIDGRVTAQDIGMGRMIAAGKDCIGKAMAGRAHLQDDTARPHLVGLKPIGPVQRLLAGSHIVVPGAAPVSDNDEGYVSSVCYSPTLGHMIGLGFVRGGRSRIGEAVRAVDLLRDFDTLCEITSPVFVDSDGARLRG